jgi:hypothetical protein
MKNTSKTSDSCKSRETPGEIRKQAKRLKESRDILKEKNREKALKLKAQHGKIDDLTQSRDTWREQVEGLQESVEQLQHALAEEQKRSHEREILTQKHEQLLAQRTQEQLYQQLAYEKQIEELKKKLIQ